MNMPKSRDIQAKIPLPQAIWNEFWLRYCERSEQKRKNYHFYVFLSYLLSIYSKIIYNRKSICNCLFHSNQVTIIFLELL